MTAWLEKSVICPVLISRTPLLESLQRRTTQAHAGRGGTIVIGGEAGIGKSRLVAEIKNSAVAQGFLPLQGSCFEPDRMLPYAPLLDLLRAFIATRSLEQLIHDLGSNAAVLVKLLPELATPLSDLSPLPALDPEQEKRRLFQTLTEFFTRLATAQPLLVIVEDVHWSDDTSLEFLLYLGRRLTPCPILLLLTYRSDEKHPALQHFLAEVDREHLAVEAMLAPLSRADVEMMLRAIFELPRPMTTEFLDTLYTVTEGNPFFVEEILKSLMAAGEIYYANGVWERKPLQELRIPRSVQDAVARRVARLSDTARQTVTLAAVAGRRFDFGLLQHLTGRDEMELLQLVKGLMAAQLVVEESAERFAFRHALTRQAIYSELLARERQQLHRTIAETTERMYAASLDTHLGDLAHHFYEAGAWEQAFEYSRRAGELAERLFAYQEAASHYDRARQCTERLNQPEQLAAIDEALGNVNLVRGQFSLAIEFYERALARASTHETRAALKAKMGRAYARTGDEAGAALLRAALEELNPETQRIELAQTTTNLGRYYHYHMQHTQAIEFFERANELAEPFDDPETLTTIYGFLAGAYQHLTRYEPGMKWARQAIALGERKNYPLALAAGNECISEGLMQMGQWSDALIFAQRNREIGEKFGLLDRVAWSEYDRAFILFGQGDLHAAVTAARSALALAEEIGEGRVAILIGAQLSICETDLGEDDAARANAQLAMMRADESGQPYNRCWSRHALAYFYLQREEFERAVEMCDQCIKLMAGSETRMEPLLHDATYAQAYLGQGRRDQAAIIIGELSALAEQAHAAHYQAVAHRVQGQIFTSQELWDDAVRAFDQAIGTLDELGSRLELARALYYRGVTHYTSGRLDAARDDSMRARALFEALGAKPMRWRTHVALARVYQAQSRHEEAENAWAAARKIVEDLAADLSDASREKLLQRAQALIPPPRPTSPHRAAKKEFGGLTERERQVAARLAQGESNREIAEALVLSERTVESHVANILNKLGFSTRAQIRKWAREKGLVNPIE